MLCAGISKAMTGKVKAGDFVKFATEQVGGKSSGRLGLEQAGVRILQNCLKYCEAWKTG